MRFVAKNRYVWYSPQKLRPLVSVIRGKKVIYALNWLYLYKNKRAIPIRKTLVSAVANAKDLEGVTPEQLFVKEISVDRGPIRRYYKPGAMGKSVAQRKRQCHIKIVLESKDKEGK